MNYKKLIIIWAIFSFSYQLTGIQPAFSESGIIIITNPSVNETSISENALRNIFLGDKSVWQDGKKINFVLLKRGTVHNSFLESYINKTSKRFMRYWKRKILTGEAIIPRLVATEKEVVEYVTKTEGAIGYVSEKTNIHDLKKMLISK